MVGWINGWKWRARQMAARELFPCREYRATGAATVDGAAKNIFWERLASFL